MPLDEYHRKRDFAKSPEPRGDEARRTPPRRETRFFCVQKHLASHLHYDLRLEHNGVLLSWAVPKGPSLNPRDKRMAVHVEDHPVEYGNFEGVIPEGYGAGIVLLWDYGTWEPEVDDLDAALRKGDLKFTLDGYKLKGSWVLVQTRDRSGISPGQQRGGPRRHSRQRPARHLGLKPAHAERCYRSAAHRRDSTGHGEDPQTNRRGASRACGASGERGYGCSRAADQVAEAARRCLKPPPAQEAPVEPQPGYKEATSEVGSRASTSSAPRSRVQSNRPGLLHVLAATL